MVKLFTHTDLDGIGCAILAKLCWGDEVDITYCNYDNIDEQVMEYVKSGNFNREWCYITDISIKEETAQLLNICNFPKIRLYDHHPTALDLNKHTWCKVVVEENDKKVCGTELFYNAIKDKLPKDFSYSNIETFVNMVSDYDTWRWSTMGDDGLVTKQVNDMLYILGRPKFIDWVMDKIQGRFGFELSETDKLLLNIRQNEIDNYIKEKDKQLIVKIIQSKDCGCVFAEKYISELGNKLCELHPELDLVIMINIGSGTVSYRTIKSDVDLGKFAKEYGGGGHPKAAGSSFESQVNSDTISRIFD